MFSSQRKAQSSEGEYQPDTDNTEELDGSGFIRTSKTTVGTPKDRPFQALKFTININGKPTRAIADTGTIGGILISNKFVTTHTAKKHPCMLKMAVKESRLTSNFSVEVMIQLGMMRVERCLLCWSCQYQTMISLSVCTIS